MSIHRGDNQTKQEFGGQDDDFGNRDLTHCPSLTHDTHTRTHIQREITCAKTEVRGEKN